MSKLAGKTAQKEAIDKILAALDALENELVECRKVLKG